MIFSILFYQFSIRCRRYGFVGNEYTIIYLPRRGFTYSRSQIADVYYYIENQGSHHKKRTFREEYIDILTKNEIEFDQQFLFDFWNDCL